MNWQRRARWGVAVFGIACAIAVYAAIGERQATTPLTAPERLDPRAILESEGAQVQQERGAERDFDIKSERQLVYENGVTRLIGVEISVRNRGGRDFLLYGGEVQAADNQKNLQLEGNVRLEANDGFRLFADRATFNQDDGVVRASGEVHFTKGRMSGAGVDMTYDQNRDVISLAEGASVVLEETADAAPMDFTAGSAVLDRAQDTLTLEREVHVYRGGQVFIADRAVARLTSDEGAVTFIELRGSARVEGSGALEAMAARDIDLDYTDDGQTLERVLLAGDAAVSLTGQSGAPGRQISGDRLDLTLAPDGALTRALGRDNVQLTLPATDAAPARTIEARTLDAVGEPEKGLTSARFADDVVFTEQAARDGTARTARSRQLQVALEADAIGSALFTGSVQFEEKGLQASGGEARYEPEAGTLRLAGVEGGRPPRVADERITVEAPAIAVRLDRRDMNASGGVRATLRGEQDGASRVPGLLQQGQPVNVKADALQYLGATGRAVYRGSAELWQGDTTAVRGNVITIDQQTGDLAVEGAARSDILLDNERSIGRAAEIRYDDRQRVIAYIGDLPPPQPSGLRQGAPPPTPPPAPALPAAAAHGGRAASPAPPAPGPAQLSGPQGDLRAHRIEVVLAREGTGADRLEAYTAVDARIGGRVATGDRLTYFSRDQRYVMTAAGAVPVRVTDACRVSTGKTLTFFKGTDRILVDGNEEIRTQTTSGSACTPAPAAR